MRILTLSARYLPGYKAGGPIRTLAGMVDRLGEEFRFQLITSDRDSGDTAPYPGVAVDAWQQVGKGEVFYLSPESASLTGLRRVIGPAAYDVIYLNSFFSHPFTIRPLLLHRFGRIRPVPLIVAPRGELSLGALALKAPKKRLYLALARALHLYRGVVWQASSEHEEHDIRRHFGPEASVVIAPDLPAPAHPMGDLPQRRKKSAGRLNVMFLSRVVRMKNLSGALSMLGGVKGEVNFDIYGPLEDPGYWRECQSIISRLPANISVQYQGAVHHREVSAIMREHDLLLLPTLGENFGHVILESLLSGCPVLISDRTLWRGLEIRGVGWDLPLDEIEGFQAALQQCLEMADEEHRGWSVRAREYGLEFSQDSELIEKNRGLFRSAVSTRT